MAQTDTTISTKNSTETIAHSRISFIADLLDGKFRFDKFNLPISTMGNTEPVVAELYQRLKQLLHLYSADVIYLNGFFPDKFLNSLAQLGVFGLTIPKEFGGLGLSVQALRLLLMQIGSYHTGLFYLLTHHYSVVNAILNFGDQNQKTLFLKDMAAGKVATTAIFEGADHKEISKIKTTLTANDSGYLLNGIKSRIPHCQRTGFVLVVAKDNATQQLKAVVIPINDNDQKIQVTSKQNYLGLNPPEHIGLNFNNLKVSLSHLLGKQGSAEKLIESIFAFQQFQISIGAAGLSKTILECARYEASTQKVWGRYLGHHELYAHRIAKIAGYAFAIDSMTELTTHLYQLYGRLPLETPLARIYSTEAIATALTDFVNIREELSFETTESQKTHSERPIGLGRLLLDWQTMMTLFESNDALRLKIVVSGIAEHKKRLGKLYQRHNSGSLLRNAFSFTTYYTIWYLKLWLGKIFPRFRGYGKLAKHARFVNRTTQKLARNAFWGVLQYRRKIDKRQAFLGRLVDIASEVYAISAVLIRANQEFLQGNRNAANIADAFCFQARRRIDLLYHELWKDNDRANYKLGRQILDRQFTWMEVGGAGLTAEQLSHTVSPLEDDPVVAEIFATVFKSG
jgi:hypothetical protein